MVCCTRCFDDEYLMEFVKSFDTKGACDYCGSKKVYVADLSDVGRFIRQCVSKAYEDVDESGLYWDSEEKEYTAGQFIEDILIDEHRIFSEKKLSADGQRVLLHDLISKSGPKWRDLKDGAIDHLGGSAILVLRDSFYGPDYNIYEYSWSTFKYTVKHFARFFDLGQIHDKRDEILGPVLALLEEQSIAMSTGTFFWRARAAGPDLPKSAVAIQNELGPPPLDEAKHNRMSPPGISYTYLSDSPETCISELKPNVGKKIWLGRFRLNKDLRLLDLVNVKRQFPGSIFSPDYDHDKNWATSFLVNFAHEISLPLRGETDTLDYIPTQVFTELIRSRGYNGVKYRSSQFQSGTNYTLFCGPTIQTHFYPFTSTNITRFTDWMRLTLLKTVSIKEIEYKTENSLFDKEQSFTEADMSEDKEAQDESNAPF